MLAIYASPVIQNHFVKAGLTIPYELKETTLQQLWILGLHSMQSADPSVEAVDGLSEVCINCNNYETVTVDEVPELLSEKQRALLQQLILLPCWRML